MTKLGRNTDEPNLKCSRFLSPFNTFTPQQFTLYVVIHQCNFHLCFFVDINYVIAFLGCTEKESQHGAVIAFKLCVFKKHVGIMMWQSDSEVKWMEAVVVQWFQC